MDELLAQNRPSPRGKIVLGTRGSDLALAQARMAQNALREKSSIDLEIKIVRTTGDEDPSRSSVLKIDSRKAGRKGIFTAELERALIQERIDVAIHSAKDIPSEVAGGLIIAAALPRANVEDLLLRKRHATAPVRTIATGSIRRERQASAVNPEVRIVALRGNVPTRLRKFIESDWDAVILARAGLERLGLFPPEFEFEGRTISAQILSGETFVPAGGQGIIVLQTREADSWVRQIVSSVDDAKTHLCLRAEREFLRLLEGDCDMPVGVHAWVVNGAMELRAQVFGDAQRPKIATGHGSDPEKLALTVFRKL